MIAKVIYILLKIYIYPYINIYKEKSGEKMLKTFVLRLEEEDLEYLKKLADEYDRPISRVIRKLLKEAIELQKKGELKL